jgi:hypothetical protein
VRLAVLMSLMLPPATLPASSAFQRLAAAGKCKKNKVIFCFYFLFRDMSRSKNVRLQRKSFSVLSREKSFLD